eukprot:jgi/Hompol1/2976/HPOL_006268-RA
MSKKTPDVLTLGCCSGCSATAALAVAVTIVARVDGRSGLAEVFSLERMRQLVVLYGSQTGCAQEAAERVAREARRRHFHVLLQSMDEYDKAKLPTEELVLFVCSVTGQGEEPDNMKRFWKFLLRKNLPPDSLQDLKFGVFGLGDSSYQKFNFPAKKLHKRLLQLGAQAIVPRGDGDDQHDYGMDGAFDPWLEQTWKAVMKLYPMPPGKEIIPADTLPEPSFNIVFLDQSVAEEPLVGSSNGVNTEYAEITKTAKLVENKRITAAGHFQDVRHLSFELPEGSLYNPGDVMTIMPENLPSSVDAALEHFGWTELADMPIKISAARSATTTCYTSIIIPNDKQQTDIHMPPQLTGKQTVRRLLEKHLDLFGRPRRYFFELVSFFATDLQHRDKLR